MSTVQVPPSYNDRTRGQWFLSVPRSALEVPYSLEHEVGVTVASITLLEYKPSLSDIVDVFENSPRVEHTFVFRCLSLGDDR